MRILHVFRSPVGGLFRHVRDLARGQAALGHEVGLLCDNSTGGAVADSLITAMKSQCSLGIYRQAMSKLPGFGDLACVVQTAKLARRLNVDVVHGHGAKGGLYGRLAAKMAHKIAVYTPHGGSLHYEWGEFPGPFFLGTEWLLRKTNGAMVFVCAFEKDLFAQKIGLGMCQSRVVHNGLWPEEFSDVPVNPNATDLLFVGEMRLLKGVDVLLRAIAELKPRRIVTATLVGAGPDIMQFKALAQHLNIAEQVHFTGAMKMAEALPLGRIFVLPSRNESFPYVMLEAIAASKPIVATHVGGIGEVIPVQELCAAGDVSALATALKHKLDNLVEARADATYLANQVRTKFSAQGMAEQITEFYKSLI